MSIFQDAHVVVLLADYIGVDAGAKLNAIGAGFTQTGGQAGMTAPQHVAVLVDIPSKFVGQEFVVSLQLQNETAGHVVQVPGANGQLEALRMQQVARVERPIPPPGVYIPEEMFCRVQVILGFPMGLAIPDNSFFAWQAEIDGQTRPGWRARFYVPGLPPGPVFGGPAGPASIPNVPHV